MKPSVPKVVISTDKPKAPVIISKSKERVATKQEQVSITRGKVNSSVITTFGFYPFFFTNLLFSSKNTNDKFPALFFFLRLFHLQTSRPTAN